MPFVSSAQRGYFNANRGKLEKQGVDVDEWNSASKGKKLPKHVKRSRKNGQVSDRAASKSKTYGGKDDMNIPGSNCVTILMLALLMIAYLLWYWQ